MSHFLQELYEDNLMEKQEERDFTAIYECEHCGATEKGCGYDDDNFHRNVIPAMKCKACGKKGACQNGLCLPCNTKRLKKSLKNHRKSNAQANRLA